MAWSTPAAVDRGRHATASRIDGEQPQPVGRAGQRVDRVLGVGHQARTRCPPSLTTPAMSRASRWGSRPARSAARPGPAPACRALVGRVVAAGHVLDGDRQEVARRALARERRVGGRRPRASTCRQTKRSADVGQQRARQQARLAQTWKPLQIPITGPPSRGELDHRLHDRREAGDRAGAQVVAVGEAAGDDDGVDARAGRGRRATAGPPRRAARTPSRASTSSQEPGKADDAELHAVGLEDSRSPRSAGSRAAARTSPAAARGPRRRARSGGRRGRCSTPSKPSAGSARSTVWPCGSRMPALGRTGTRALIRRRPLAAEPGVERLAA